MFEIHWLGTSEPHLLDIPRMATSGSLRIIFLKSLSRNERTSARFEGRKFIFICMQPTPCLGQAFVRVPRRISAVILSKTILNLESIQDRYLHHNGPKRKLNWRKGSSCVPFRWKFSARDPRFLSKEVETWNRPGLTPAIGPLPESVRPGTRFSLREKFVDLCHSFRMPSGIFQHRVRMIKRSWVPFLALFKLHAGHLYALVDFCSR